MGQQNRGKPEPDCRQQDDQRSITWREFLIICGQMYRQVLPGMLLLAGVILLLITMLLYISG